MSEPPEVVSREQLLGGLGGRRASTLLFAVESRVAYLAQRAADATAPAICDDLVEARGQGLLAALASGREVPPAPVRIQDLERFVAALAHIIPADAGTRADLAHRLAVKYPARESDVRALRAVLGLGDANVADALQTRYGLTPAQLWAGRIGWRERMRWAQARLVARLDHLSPFWTSFGLTLTQTVGAGVLALPIALSGVGPLAGVVLIVLMGAVNVVTVAKIAESLTRTGPVRWGGAYLGQVVGRYLGAGARVVLSVAMVAIAVVALLAYYVGFSSVLDAATGVPAPGWALVLFVVTAGFVWRGRLDATVASALLVGSVNVVILLVLSGLAFADLDPANLTEVAGSAGQSFDPTVAAAAFGVVLLAFFGHTSVANCARVVLRREPGGRSLLRGAIAGMITAAALYSVWTFAVTGAVAPAGLADERGTVLEPLADATGPLVLAVGSIFVVLAMGMAAVHFSLGLHFQARELIRGDGRAARLAAIGPLVAVFAVAEALLMTNRESFTGSLSAAGTLAVPFIAGVIPVLLFASAQRRGDGVPEPPARWLASRTLSVAVYAVFVLALVAHAAVIWTSSVARVSAAAAAVIGLALTGYVLHTDAMRPLLSVELRRDRDQARYRLRVMASGAPATVPVIANGHDSLPPDRRGAVDLPRRTTTVTVDLAAEGIDQLRLWTHEVDTVGESGPLTVRLSLDSAAGQSTTRRVQGESLMPLPDGGGLIIELPEGRSGQRNRDD
ncbi:MAG TPA: aromatic amino acid transport family protein [Jiangellaceae bacterium]